MENASTKIQFIGSEQMRSKFIKHSVININEGSIKNLNISRGHTDHKKEPLPLCSLLNKDKEKGRESVDSALSPMGPKISFLNHKDVIIENKEPI
jgi:hypothetical protein